MHKNCDLTSEQITQILPLLWKSFQQMKQRRNLLSSADKSYRHAPQRSDALKVHDEYVHYVKDYVRAYPLQYLILRVL
jgi:hypothetical protein